MYLRYRPSVMVSSSIAGLEGQRNAIRAAVESLSLADSWLFEFNAVASGSGPPAQYLQKAKDCDLFVLVVGSEIRPGTEEEYDEAFRDNPMKVLPILLKGDTGTTTALRATIRHRHTYRKATLATLPAEIAHAVEHAVRTGELSRRPLLAAIMDQQLALRSLLSLPSGFSFAQHVRVGDTSGPVASLLSTHLRVVLEGDAGAGKSDAALSALLSSAPGFLPVYCRARPKSSLLDLLEAAFDAVRYTPGPDGIRQFMRDGRLALVIDGIDELGPADRASLLNEVAAELIRYARSPAVVVTRSTSHPALSDWVRAGAEPLDDADLERLFDLMGHAGEQRVELFAKLGDLLHLPFWAPAIARFGLAATSVPELLDGVLDSRLLAALPDDVVGRLRLSDAMAHLARRLRPTVETDTATALAEVTSWGRDVHTRERFGRQPAERVLERCVSTGMLIADAERIRFIHPLIAAHLAARHAVALEDLSMLPEDDDLRAFVAVQLNEQRAADWLEVVNRTSPFLLFRVLRLAGPRARDIDFAADLARYDIAYRRLARLGGQVVEDAAVGFTTAVLKIGGSVCIRQVVGTEPKLGVDIPLEKWLGAGRPVRFTCWANNPFRIRWPEQLAGEQILRELKETWVRLNPGGSPYAPFGADPSSVLNPRVTLSARILGHLVAVAKERERLIRAAGLEAWLDLWPGEPSVVVGIGLSNPRFKAIWGHEERSVAFDDSQGRGFGRSVTDLLIEPSAVAYRDLSSELNYLLGETLQSASLRGPSPMDWSL